MMFSVVGSLIVLGMPTWAFFDHVPMDPGSFWGNLGIYLGCWVFGVLASAFMFDEEWGEVPWPLKGLWWIVAGPWVWMANRPWTDRSWPRGKPFPED